jgi:hypothetical protein
MDPVEAVKLEVRAWLPRLGALTEQMTRGHVRIEVLDEHRRERRYRVGMELTLPDGIVAVTHVHPSNLPHEDVYVAVRNAFRAARRELEEHYKNRITVPAPAQQEPREESQSESFLATVIEPPSEMVLPPDPRDIAAGRAEE